MNPLISVIIPVYNAGEHIKPCLDSLIQQTLKDIEIICVLDCPTDGTDKLVEEYAQKDERIKIIKNEKNLNIGESRNRGIAAATGEYIGFSDHDDYRELTMYEDLYNIAQKEDAEVVLSGLLAHMAIQWKTVEKDNLTKYILEQLVRRKYTNHIHPHIFKTSFIKEFNIHFIDTKKYSIEDTLFNSRLYSYIILNKKKIALVDHNYYTHVEYQRNQNKSYSYWEISKIKNSIKELLDIWYIYNFNKECITVFAYKSLYTSFNREVSKNGLLNAIKLFKNELGADKDIVNVLKLRNTLWDKDMTLPKNIFADVLKAII